MYWADWTIDFLWMGSSVVRIWLKSRHHLWEFSYYIIKPYTLGRDGMSQPMIKTSSDEVDLHSHEKFPEVSVAL